MNDFFKNKRDQIKLFYSTIITTIMVDAPAVAQGVFDEVAEVGDKVIDSAVDGPLKIIALVAALALAVFMAMGRLNVQQIILFVIGIICIAKGRDIVDAIWNL